MADAHCRIGKVTMKGGASLHVLPTVKRDSASDTLVRWAAQAADDGFDAYGAVAWQRDGDSWLTTSTFWSRGAIPHSVIPVMAEEALRSSMTIGNAETRVMSALGYVQDDPDPAL